MAFLHASFFLRRIHHASLEPSFTIFHRRVSIKTPFLSVGLSSKDIERVLPNFKRAQRENITSFSAASPSRAYGIYFYNKRRRYLIFLMPSLFFREFMKRNLFS